MSSQKVQSVKTRSIANRINRVWFFRTLRNFLLIDILLAVCLLILWCYMGESAVSADITRHASRSLSWDTSLPLFQRLPTLTYTFLDSDSILQTVQNTAFLTALQYCFLALFSAEGLVLLFQYFSGKRTAQRLLWPLEKMAITTQQLTNEKLDPQMLHQLEDALATTSPLSPNDKLRTGNKELQGLEKAINDLLTRMHNAYREQNRFVSDASHELRTPIAVIQGYADMLSRWGKEDKTVLDEGITAIKSEAEHMNRLVEQLLFLARGDSGKNQPVLSRIDLTALIKEVYEEYQMITPERRWRFVGDMPVFTSGDPGLIKQAARILTDNAIKYTGKDDSITLSAKVKDGVPCFEVQDNGIGIKQEDMAHIFDRFFRSDTSRTRATGGNGLGLSIAKWIVDRHKGYFDIVSREDFGTRFTVMLPEQPLPEPSSPQESK
ncbi:MAG: HAMP domain-containing histidine kinase [Clostridia bacterium]|nr:HAMP domain-containing histidine kinase [Clostridia bacterium]